MDDQRCGRKCGGNMHWMKGRDEIGGGRVSLDLIDALARID